MTVQLPRVQSPETDIPRKRNTTNYGPDLGSGVTKLGDEARDTGPTDADRQGSHGDGKGVLGILGLSRKSSKAAEDDDNGKNKLEQHFTFMSQIRATVFNSWINALLIACESSQSVRISIANLHSAGWDRAQLCACPASRRLCGQLHRNCPSCGNA